MHRGVENATTTRSDGHTRRHDGREDETDISSQGGGARVGLPFF